MGQNVLDTLKERGFIKQVVFEEDLYKLLGEEKIKFYVGFDPTADSLHVGHFVALMAMAHLQKAGHTPVILIGGGTAMIGDPSGRTDMRSMLTREDIVHNVNCFRAQMSRFFSFEGENAAFFVDNANWLLNLNYVDFLRDIGSLFSVNRMLTAECFKSRLEKGLSFLEFNYMLMQAYDFLYLCQNHGVVLQCGGDDQWSNILAGADLIRRKEQKPAYAMTFSLLLKADGEKMGKTAGGALWLDKEKTSPYDFYQYFRNVADEDVSSCLRFLTFLPLDEINSMVNCFSIVNGVRQYDKAINDAKERLAYEVTKLVHGENEAKLALEQARGAFGAGDVMPEAIIPKGLDTLVDIIVELGLEASKGAAKRLIQGGGIKINDDKIGDIEYVVPQSLLEKGFVLHKGKKVHLQIYVK